MFAKILISGKIEVVSGLHIGTGGEYSAIGAADSPVIRDVSTGLPMIPGSSLKGKLRSLLARKYNKSHAASPDHDEKCIVSLFGGMKVQSRLIFSDMYMSNMDKLKESGIYDPTEIKFENNINRLTAVANPRQIERVIRTSEFDMNVIYNAENKDETEQDITLLADGMKMLCYDYLGGHGSRGYGKIKFDSLRAEVVFGDDDGELDDIIEKCNEILKGVQNEI